MPPKLFVLVDCNVTLFLRSMQEGEGEMEMWTRPIGFHDDLVTYFDFRDEASPPGKIDWTQALT